MADFCDLLSLSLSGRLVASRNLLWPKLVAIIAGTLKEVPYARRRCPIPLDGVGIFSTRHRRRAGGDPCVGRPRPALSLTPVAMADQINSAAQTVRAEDRQTLNQMHGQLAQTVGRVSELVGRKRATVEQECQLIRIGLGGLLAGILLWSILPGAVARSLPVSWHVPEWMASRTMGMEQKEAGRRMVLTAPKEAGR